ncbi:glycosyltransferase family 39 protein [Salinicola corii]|uniref:Glycosyltransferase family 39 protein n=1 Tax=Salinicola corii TaxID=2606937 RepID=A0A640WBX8_9GAMM|nr:glycosyltransferase family 39 protein [Salinicola corii]KAA0016955.1 glycosyltransferase family 39 protein [Salinicola corii]
MRRFLSDPSQAHYRRAWLLLLLFTIVLLGIGIGLRDPWPADEPRFALNALEMLRTGQFWFPHRGGELYPDKPPVFMWASALSIWLTGSVRWGFLIPTALAGIGTLLLTVDLCRRLYGRRIALMSGLALLSAFQFVLQAKTAQIDMMLTFCTTLATYGLLRHALLGPARIWWLAGWAAMGLGIITKGVGILPLTLLPAWLWMTYSGHSRGPITRITLKDAIQGIAAMLLCIAAWAVPMIVMSTWGDDPSLAAYRDNILFKQTGQRYADSWTHLEPWYYYLVSVLPWAWMPLILAFPWALPAWWRRLRRSDPRFLLPLSSIVLIVIFFSLSPGKRGVYMLPTLPLLVLAMAPLLPGLVTRKRLHWLGFGLLTLLGGLLLAAGVLGAAGLPALAKVAERHAVSPWAWWIVIGTIAAGLLALRPRRGLWALTIWLVVFWVSWSTWGYALQDHARSPRGMMAQVRSITGAGAWLAMPDFDEEFLLQSRQPSIQFGDRTPASAQFRRAFAWLQQDRSRWMFAMKRQAKDYDCINRDQIHDMGIQNGDDWWLIPATAVGRCQGDADAATIFVAPTTLPDDTGSAPSV